MTDLRPDFSDDDPIRAGAEPGTVTFHPNLARLAASYQRIVERYALGHIDAVQANVEIRELVARDDEGVMWTINPRDGGWLFRDRHGRWQPGTPPTWGLATLTAHDLSVREVAAAGTAFNPDVDVTFRAVEESRLPAASLRGATRRHVPAADTPWQRPRWLYPLVVAVVSAVVVFGVAAARDSGTQAPATPVTSVAVPPAPGGAG